jgi:hypothetical protein
VHWFWKVLIALLSLAVVGIIGLIAVIYIALPSPAKLRSSMFDKATAVARSRKMTASRDADDAAARVKIEENEHLFNSFLDKSRPLSESCASLRSIKFPQQKKLDAAEFGKRFKKSLEDDRNDPQFESLKPILKFTLTQPVMLDVIDQVRTAKPQSMIEEFKTKKDFYYLLARAYEEMKANKVAMQTVLDQSYLTMMLGRAVEAKPSLATDTAVSDVCDEIESGLNQNRTIDYVAEKKAFEKVLSDNSIDPKSIGYDPNYKTDLQIAFNEHGLHFAGGWIDQIFEQLVPKK